MPGFGAYMVAGAASGLGEDLIARAKEARDRAMETFRTDENIRQNQAQLADADVYDERDRNREIEHAGKVGDFFTEMTGSESGGDSTIINDEGYGGGQQFGQARLDDWSQANGTPRVTVEQFAKDKNLQKTVEAWHWKDIDSAIDAGLADYEGTVINGVTITRPAMLAIAHLGGKNGLKQFLESGGKYDPADSNGTTLTDYARKFAGTTLDWGRYAELYGHPDTTEAQRELLDAGAKRRGFNVAGDGKLTGEHWEDDPARPGWQTRTGQDEDGNAQPYIGTDGKPQTRRKPDSDLSASMLTRLQKDSQQGDSYAPVDPAYVQAMGDEVTRLMRDEGMPETDAYLHAQKHMKYPEVEETSGGILGTGFGAKTTKRRGKWAGEFDYGQQTTTETQPDTTTPPPAPTTEEEPPATTEAPETTTEPVDPVAVKALVEQARAAIARNATPEQLEQRMREAGVPDATIAAVMAGLVAQ